MNSVWLSILTDILGVGTQVVPLFIHNPKSNTIEAIIVADLPTILAQLSAATASTKPAGS